MAIFDDIKGILENIDQKLGEQAPRKAAALDHLLPKKKEDDKFKLQGIENSIQKAFSRIPVLNQLIPAIRDFHSVIIDLLALRGAFNGLRDFGSAMQVATRAWSRQPGAARAQLTAEGLFGVTGGPQGASQVARRVIATRYRRGDRGFLGSVSDLARSEFRIGRGRATGNWARSALGRRMATRTVGGLAGGAASIRAISGVAARLMAALANPIGITVAAITALAVAIPLVTAGLIGFAKKLVEGRRHLSELNAQYALAFAQADISKMFRNMRSAAATHAATTKFLNVWNQFLDKIQPTLDELFNLFVKFATVLLNAINFIIDKAPSFRTVQNWGLGGPLGGWMGKYGYGPWDVMTKGVDWLWGDIGKKNVEGKILSTTEKINRAMDLIIEAHQLDASGSTAVTAAAFMAGAAQAPSMTVSDINRPDLKEIWKTHQEIK